MEHALEGAPLWHFYCCTGLDTLCSLSCEHISHVFICLLRPIPGELYSFSLRCILNPHHRGHGHKLALVSSYEIIRLREAFPWFCVFPQILIFCGVESVCLSLWTKTPLDRYLLDREPPSPAPPLKEHGPRQEVTSYTPPGKNMGPDRK